MGTPNASSPWLSRKSRTFVGNLSTEGTKNGGCGFIANTAASSSGDNGGRSGSEHVSDRPTVGVDTAPSAAAGGIRGGGGGRRGASKLGIGAIVDYCCQSII